MKPFAVRDKKLREVLISYFFILIIGLMLSRIFNEPLMSISNKHNYKTFTKNFPASLLHNYQLKKDDTDISLSFSSRISFWYIKRLHFFDN